MLKFLVPIYIALTGAGLYTVKFKGNPDPIVYENIRLTHTAFRIISHDTVCGIKLWIDTLNNTMQALRYREVKRAQLYFDETMDCNGKPCLNVNDENYKYTIDSSLLPMVRRELRGSDEVFFAYDEHLAIKYMYGFGRAEKAFLGEDLLPLTEVEVFVAKSRFENITDTLSDVKVLQGILSDIYKMDCCRDSGVDAHNCIPFQSYGGGCETRANMVANYLEKRNVAYCFLKIIPSCIKGTLIVEETFYEPFSWSSHIVTAVYFNDSLVVIDPTVNHITNEELGSVPLPQNAFYLNNYLKQFKTVGCGEFDTVAFETCAAPDFICGRDTITMRMHAESIRISRITGVKGTKNICRCDSLFYDYYK